MTRRPIRSLVRAAYADGTGTARARIMRQARAWYGLDRPGRLGRRWSDLFIRLVNQAQSVLHREGEDSDLGTSPIGFDDLHIHCRSSDANSSVVYLYGFSDNLTHFDLYRDYAHPGTTAIDVGANLGIHTSVLAACVGPAGRVHAFEPVPAIHDRLRQNLGLNRLEQVVTHPMAAGEGIGRAGFSADAAGFNIGKGRLDRDSPHRVDLTTLDEAVIEDGRPVSLIKIDVEGHERAVLAGARTLLERHRPALVVEFNPGGQTLRELTGTIPYRVVCNRVPHTYWGRLEPYPGEGDGRTVELLLLPYH